MNLQWIRFLSASEALSSRLAFVDTTTNHAIMKVDNTSTVVYNDKRNSVRLQTNVRYSVGSVWIADMIHVPYGVSSNSFCLLYSAADGSTRSARCGLPGNCLFQSRDLLKLTSTKIQGGQTHLTGQQEGEEIP